MGRNLKISLFFIFLLFFTPIFSLFLVEIYLNRDNSYNFISSRESFNNEKYDFIEEEVGDKGTVFSNKRVKFVVGGAENEVWSRDSYFIESIRWQNYQEANFNERYLSDFYKFKRDELFLKNRAGSKEGFENFRVKVNTLPLDNNKESILIIGDSFVAGQNFIDENRIWYKIFVEKINDLYKDNYFNVISAGRNGWGFYDYVLHASNLIKNINFDYLVIGFLPNDYENTDIGILRDGFSNNNGYEYINCINGREGFSNIVLKLYSIFPKSSRAIIMRYCEKYFNINWVGDYDYNDRFDLFKDSLMYLKEFSRKNGFEVIFMPLNPMENSGIVRDDKIYNLISDIGFDIIPSYFSDNIIKERDKRGWVNPIDWHPSVSLSYAYGEDIYNYFVKRFNILESNGSNSNNKEANKFNYSKEFELYNYISSIKPFDLNFKFGKNEIRIDNIGKDMYGTTSGYYNFLPMGENVNFRDKIYPKQSALCAKINRAHLEVAFNDKFINNRFLLITNRHKSNSIIVGSKSYSGGEEIYNEGYKLFPGESVTLEVKGGLILANIKDGCELAKEIKLDEFDVSIKV
jgi:hypothetical protein